MGTSKPFQRLTKLHDPVERVQLVVSEKLMSAYLFQIAREKSCNYVLIIYMKKYEIAYHNYAEASDMMRLVKTTTYAQNNNIQCYFQIFKAQKKIKVRLDS